MQCSFTQQAFSEHLLHSAFWSRGQGRAESLLSREVPGADLGLVCGMWTRMEVWEAVEGGLCCRSTSSQTISAVAASLLGMLVRGYCSGPRDWGLPLGSQLAKDRAAYFPPQPLNPNPDSRWNTYFRDNEVLLQIDKDVR